MFDFEYALWFWCIVWDPKLILGLPSAHRKDGSCLLILQDLGNWYDHSAEYLNKQFFQFQIIHFHKNIYII